MKVKWNTKELIKPIREMKLTDLQFTPGPWYVVDYAGYNDLQIEDGYNGESILDKDFDDLAENNGFLASKAPDLLAELVEAREQLKSIMEWDMPDTGKTWDDGSKMSYAAAHGSHGERDVIRTRAKEAIDKINKLLNEETK